jgi:hypothetical protein
VPQSRVIGNFAFSLASRHRFEGFNPDSALRFDLTAPPGHGAGELPKTPCRLNRSMQHHLIEISSF